MIRKFDLENRIFRAPDIHIFLGPVYDRYLCHRHRIAVQTTILNFNHKKSCIICVSLTCSLSFLCLQNVHCLGLNERISNSLNIVTHRRRHKFIYFICTARLSTCKAEIFCFTKNFTFVIIIIICTDIIILRLKEMNISCSH